MRFCLFICIGIVLLVSLLTASSFLTSLMRQRPVAVQLGYVPSVTILKMLPKEHHEALAASLNLKVLSYFGSLVQEWMKQIMLPPEYDNMYRTLETAVQLDPYNADPYYFTQAIFTWDAGQFEDVNRLLEYGMEYRDWDPMLPFFAGFNAGYHLKDYDKASQYMARAARVSGNSGIARLASRYFYESGDVTVAIEFLRQMESTTSSQREADLYRLRREAFEAVKIIQNALTTYQQRVGVMPGNLQVLVDTGDLSMLPVDPYGGQFFIDESGQIRSTSGFSQRRASHN